MKNNACILVIDDDPLIRFMISTTLAVIGFSTIEAASGEQGMDLFFQHGVDAILLDVVMPGGIDGFEACAALRAEQDGEHVPILMMTSLEDMKSIDKAYEVGATDFIAKPVNIPLLGHRLRYMLRYSETTKRLLESEQRLHRMAYFDSLTELPNRQFFVEHLQHIIPLVHRQKKKLGVLFLDLDDFKRINDTLGHHVGDIVLQETSKRLLESIRGSDVMTRTGINNDGSSLARLGGDEFTVLLSMIDGSEDAAVIAERIRQNLSQPHIFESHELFTTSSIGLAIYPDDGEEAEELLKHADMAMYNSKREGGNRYTYFSANMTATAVRRLTLETHLRKAIERGELDLHYQPVLDLTTGLFNGLEALLRWTSPELGIVQPEEFIPVAEETGLINKVGEWVLRKACAQMQKWRNEAGLPLVRIAVNMSALQILQKGFSTLVSTVLSETGLSAEVLELELTESILIKDEAVVLEALIALKQIGVILTIDDFGTGYSSMRLLKKFPIDRLKIDQMFVQNLEQDVSNTAIASAVIALAESMGMAVTAEGVETSAQLAFLKSKNCHEVQGWYLSSALRSSEVENFFHQHQNKTL
jgi:diguanylate cyclase